MRIRQSKSAVAVCAALMIGCAAVVVVSEANGVTPLGASNSAAYAGPAEAAGSADKVRGGRGSASLGGADSPAHRGAGDDRDSRAVPGVDVPDIRASTTGGGVEPTPEPGAGEEPWGGTPYIMRIGTYEPDPDAPPVDPIAPVHYEDLLDACGIWMSHGDGWVRGFLANDGRFFTEQYLHRRPSSNPPPTDAPVISDVGDPRVTFLGTAVHYRIVEEGKYLAPIAVLEWDSRTVTRYLSFEGHEPLLTRALLAHPSERTSTYTYLRVVELADDVEVVIIPRQ